MKRAAIAFWSMVTGLCLSVPAAEAATTIYGISKGPNQQIATFSLGDVNPVLTRNVFVQGLQPNEELLGIDVRPNDQMIYGVGSAGRLYRINSETGVASLVAALTRAGEPLTLNGTYFGVDFNPVVDRLRVVSNLGQNLRINPNDGTTIVDGNLFFPSDPNRRPSITAVAYANNSAGVTSTTLYGVDTTFNQLVQAISPNEGSYVPINTSFDRPMNDPFSPRVDPTELTGFDIESVTNIAYATFRGEGYSRLYTINLSNGQVTSLGLLGALEEEFLIGGLAVAVVPEPASFAFCVAGLALLGRRRRR